MNDPSHMKLTLKIKEKFHEKLDRSKVSKWVELYIRLCRDYCEDEETENILKAFYKDQMDAELTDTEWQMLWKILIVKEDPLKLMAKFIQDRETKKIRSIYYSSGNYCFDETENQPDKKMTKQLNAKAYYQLAVIYDFFAENALIHENEKYNYYRLAIDAFSASIKNGCFLAYFNLGLTWAHFANCIMYSKQPIEELIIEYYELADYFFKKYIEIFNKTESEYLEILDKLQKYLKNLSL